MWKDLWQELSASWLHGATRGALGILSVPRIVQVFGENLLLEENLLAKRERFDPAPQAPSALGA